MAWPMGTRGVVSALGPLHNIDNTPATMGPGASKIHQL